MSGRTRVSALAIVCVMGWAGTGLSAFALEALDTSRLPRIAGAKDSFASAATTIYFAPDSVARTAEATRKALAAGGWQSYVAPHAGRAQDPNMEIMNFKKGPQALNVFITLAPAQGNATSVSYTAIALANDLPFPADATEIEFDPNRPTLTCLSAGTVDKLLAQYRQELRTLGWSLWSSKTGKQAEGGANGEITDKGAYVYYIKENQSPLVLVLQRLSDGRTKIEIKSVPAKVLADAREAEMYRGKPRVVTTPEPAPAAPRRAASDDMADQMMKQAQDIVRQATGEALSGAKAPKTMPTIVSGEPLRARADGNVPVPVPENTDDIEYEAADGKLEFTSAASVSALAGFYRTALKPLGWQEHRSVINRPNMTVLEFSKDGKKLSFTLMLMAGKTNVTAEGSGLVTAAADKKTTDAPAATAATPASEEDLTAEESGGLPVPKRHTSVGSERTPFRQQLNANVPFDLAAVLGFYRRELAKRDWKEEAKGADIKADSALVTFTTPTGAAVLKLGRKDNETIVTLAVKNPEAAKKAGVMPNPGQVKVLFGNMTEREATITIGGKTIKIGAGVGAKKPDGPTIDLKPGKYKYALKGGASEEIDVAADEAWGLLVGPGGVLPLNVY